MKTDDASSASHMIDRVRGEMNRFNEAGEYPYQLSFSMGLAKFDLSSETIDDFMHKIDMSMYEDKKRNHERIDRERRKEFMQ